MSTQLPDIETRELDALTEWEGNARQGDVDVIKESMRTNGVFQPIIVQAQTGKVIAGNHRLRAMRELHREAPDSWPSKVSVIPLDVTDEEALRIHLADNKTSDDAEWDIRALVAQLDEVTAQPSGLTGTGFDEDDLNDLRDQLYGDDAEERLNEVGDDEPYHEKWELVISCSSEEDQEQKFEKLTELGFEPRALNL